jgi:hypothetical protein
MTTTPWGIIIVAEQSYLKILFSVVITAYLSLPNNSGMIKSIMDGNKGFKSLYK